MKSLLRSRLDKHFATVSALAAAAAIGGAVRETSAGIVYSGPVSINIPSTFSGVYLNVVTGVNDPAPGNVPGWDVGPWNAGDLYMFSPVGGSGGFVGTATTYFNLTPGADISAAVVFSGSGTATPDAGAPLTLNSSNNLVGFRFLDENDGQVHYAWMRIALSATTASQPRTIVEYAYEDSAGQGIGAGVTTTDPNAGACCLPSGACSTILAADCASAGGSFNGAGSTCAAANCASRCCFPDGTCQMLSSSACTSAGGVSTAGQSCTSGPVCPQAGACCRNDGTCSIQQNLAACSAADGAYQGDGVTCAAAACGAFTVVSNVAGTFTDISGTGTLVGFAVSQDDDTSAITSSVTNALVTNPNLFVCTNGFISDSQAYDTYTNAVLPVAASPLTFAMYPNWDDLVMDSGGVFTQSTVENGVNVFIVQWNQARTYAGGAGSATGSFEVKIFGPSGPALAQYIFQSDSWDANGGSSTVGVQWNTNKSFQLEYNTAGSIADNAVLSVVGAATGPTCYANCDHSTTLPFLNVVDFTCFLQKFAAADPYANCDGSTQNPTLNVVDFTCFLQKFAAGCSAP